jgi:hypothetical protein
VFAVSEGSAAATALASVGRRAEWAVTEFDWARIAAEPVERDRNLVQ